MNIDFQFHGAEALGGQIGAIRDGMLERVAEALQGALEGVAGDASALATFPNGTGELAHSIHSDVQTDGQSVIGKVTASAYHSVYVEMGTGPKGQADHAGVDPTATPVYTPKGWTYHDEKGFHYTTGQPARPYLYPAFKAREDEIKSAVLRAATGDG